MGQAELLVSGMGCEKTGIFTGKGAWAEELFGWGLGSERRSPLFSAPHSLLPLLRLTACAEVKQNGERVRIIHNPITVDIGAGTIRTEVEQQLQEVVIIDTAITR